ncbi:hypothetical protein C0989_005889 [Termitomyces sp. Mn162]|nr:hypothetical protein C0989_005889 [Termitomyces sp. Mn162]
MASTSPVVKRKTNDEPTSAPRKKQHIVREQEEELALLQSLDFSALNSTSAISERFDHLGRSLIHDFHLVVKSSNEETVFEILELEFYLRKDGCHEDPFTHDSTRSLTSLTAYRGGSRKGLDITIGDPPPTTLSPYFNQAMAPNQGSTRGGALLRSLRRVPDNKVVSGPSLLVDEILRLSKAADILELVEQKWAGDTSVFGSRPTSLFLRAKAPSSQPKPTVYRSPRIGLDLSHPGTTASSSHPRVVFLTRPYRYISCPECLTSKGRPQTFLGVLQSCLDTICAGHDLASKHVLNELMRITGLGEKTASRYLEYYKNGLKSGKLKNFVGPQGKGASSSPAIYLQMMGTLAQYQVKTQQQTL